MKQSIKLQFLTKWMGPRNIRTEYGIDLIFELIRAVTKRKKIKKKLARNNYSFNSYRETYKHTYNTVKLGVR